MIGDATTLVINSSIRHGFIIIIISQKDGCARVGILVLRQAAHEKTQYEGKKDGHSIE